jgi:hypothetical protein
MKEKIIIGLFLVALFVTFLGPIGDVDFPFHLKTGEFIYEHKEIPRDDPFSFPKSGVLTDRKIFLLSQYWLAQVIFYKLYTITGPSGIILLRAAIFSSLVFLLWFAIRKRGIYSSLVIAILATFILLANVLDRPQYFSFLFTLILILLLEKFRENPDSAKPLFFMPPLMLLWSNMHGGFIFGLAVIVIYTMSEALKFFANKIKPGVPVGQPLSEKRILLLLLAGLFAILFSYINPNTNGALSITIESHTNSKWLVSAIREYMSPLEEARFPYVVKVSNISFWILFGITCILISLHTLRKKFIDITTIALVFFSSFAALTSVRYIPFFVAMAIPLTRDYRFFKDTAFLRGFTMSPIMPIIFSLFFIFAIGFGLKDYKNMFQFKVQSLYPERAARFLLDNQINAHMFNSNNRGSYLLWRLYPYYRVFQDTRYISLETTVESDIIKHAMNNISQSGVHALASALSDLVPPSLGKIEISVEGHLGNADNTKLLWKELFKKYNIDLIVHEATSDLTGVIFPLTLRLVKDDEWVLIYLDGSVQIFVRNNEKYSEIIEKFKKPKELIYDEIILETARLVKRKTTFSTPYSSLALALTMKGEEKDAKKMIDAALELDKKDLVANFCNAYLALRQKGSKNQGHLAKEPLYTTK